MFALVVLLLPSIQLLSKLITSLHFYLQEIIDWALIALFYILLYFGGSSVDSSKKNRYLNHPVIQVLLADFAAIITHTHIRYKNMRRERYHNMEITCQQRS